MVLFFKDEGVGTVAGFVVVAALDVVVVDDPPATAVLLPDMVGCVVNVGAAVVDVVAVKPGALVAVDDAAPDEAGVDVLPKPVKLKLGADVAAEVVVVVAVEGVVVALLAEGIVKPKPPVAGLAAVEEAPPAAGAPKPPKPPVVEVDGVVVEVVENNGAAPVLEGAAVDVAIHPNNEYLFIHPHLIYITTLTCTKSTKGRS